MKICSLLALLLIVLASAQPVSAADPAQPAPGEKPGQPQKVELNEMEKQFERTMSGATMVGRFSTHGQEDKHPGEDRYEISKVTKIGEDMWLFTARFGKAKLPLPIPVPVKWAGDTPVISVTKLTIPTMGTFTARIVIYDDHYAGTWDAGDHGGHMWGRIERPKDAPAPDKPKG